MRNKTILIKAGPDGPVYSATAVDGTALARDLPSERFKLLHPELHGLVHNLIADTRETRLGPPVSAPPRIRKEMEREFDRELEHRRNLSD